VHAVWSAVVVASAGLAIAAELRTPCPPGGPLSFGQCALRPVAPLVVGLGAILYVVGLSAVVSWVRQLRRRRVGDPAAAREWYLIAAILGVPIALLLAFTLVSALR
jgi:ABC-type nickel/cobalt efflux system permease component RcnA